jgi:hypothetical protein
LLSRPGQQQIQADLFYDYRTNISSYSKWQVWLREHEKVDEIAGLMRTFLAKQKLTP